MPERHTKRIERGPRPYLKAELSTQEMRLKQMGAKIEVINSFLCYIRFEVEGLKVKYVYNLNRKGQFFLERVTPYPQPAGTFDTERDVVESIRNDIAQIRQLARSSHFKELIDMNSDLRFLSKRLDSICLYYDIKPEDIAKLKKSLADLHGTFDSIRDHSQRVYFETEPFCMSGKKTEPVED
ncbi:MAG: hypothetical protein EOM02_08030 [Synergistales bacterium]|nr:hypothetical protein [Dethiosulfovibrio sp.]NCC96775.1 hypothetical protein [Synergistales bacterium]